MVIVTAIIRLRVSTVLISNPVELIVCLLFSSISFSPSVCSSISWRVRSECASNWGGAESLIVQASRRRVGLTHTWWRVWAHNQGHRPALHFEYDVIISQNSYYGCLKQIEYKTHWFFLSSRCGCTIWTASGLAGISNVLHRSCLRHRSEHHPTKTTEPFL